MKELIDPKAVEKGLLFAAIVGPLAGLIAGLLLGAHERHSTPRIVIGVMIGGIGTLAYGMWEAYGAITDALGLDSVLNLCLQIVMFAVFGALLGLGAAAVMKLIKGSGPNR